MAEEIKFIRTVEDRLQFLETRTDKMVMQLNRIIGSQQNNCKEHNINLKQITEELRCIKNGLDSGRN